MNTTKQVISFLIEKSAENKDFFEKNLHLLNENQLNWKPNNAVWSVGECIQHINLTQKLYHEKLLEATKDSVPGTSDDYSYKHSLGGKLLIRAVDPNNVKKVKTFKVFTPVSSKIDNNIFDEFNRVQKEICEIADTMKNLNLTKIKISSPVSKLFRMNIGDPLVLLPLHDRRHLNQALRLTELSEFPK